MKKPRGILDWLPATKPRPGVPLFGVDRTAPWDFPKLKRTSRHAHVCCPLIFRKLSPLCAKGKTYVGGRLFPCLVIGKMRLVSDAACPPNTIRALWL